MTVRRPLSIAALVLRISNGISIKDANAEILRTKLAQSGSLGSSRVLWPPCEEGVG